MLKALQKRMDSPSPSPSLDHLSPDDVSASTSLLANATRRTVHMVKGKVTKNTVRYEAAPEDGSAPAVKTVYVEKWALGGGPTPPESIDLILSFSSKSSKK